LTREEFDAWIEVHTACYTGVEDWLSKMSKSKRAGVLAEWFRILRKVPVDDAIRASRAMHEDENLEPKGHGKHPVAVRRIASRYQTQRNRASAERAQWRAPIDGQRTFICLECRDEGTIDVFHPAMISELEQAQPDERVTVAVTVRACPCKAGDRYRRACGTFDDEDVASTYRDADGTLEWYYPNDPKDRAKLLAQIEGIDNEHGPF